MTDLVIPDFLLNPQPTKVVVRKPKVKKVNYEKEYRKHLPKNWKDAIYTSNVNTFRGGNYDVFYKVIRKGKHKGKIQYRFPKKHRIYLIDAKTFFK